MANPHERSSILAIVIVSIFIMPLFIIFSPLAKKKAGYKKYDKNIDKNDNLFGDEG